MVEYQGILEWLEIEFRRVFKCQLTVIDASYELTLRVTPVNPDAATIEFRIGKSDQLVEIYAGVGFFTQLGFSDRDEIKFYCEALTKGQLVEEFRRSRSGGIVSSRGVLTLLDGKQCFYNRSNAISFGGGDATTIRYAPYELLEEGAS